MITISLSIKPIVGKTKNGKVLTENWQAVDYTIEQIIDHHTRQGKAINAGQFTDGYRLTENLIGDLWLAVLDYDHLTPDDLQSILDHPLVRGCAFLVSYSTNGTKAAPRVRVCFAFLEGVAPAYYGDVIRQLEDEIGIKCDKGSYQPTRAYCGDTKRRAPIMAEPGNVLDTAPYLVEARRRVAEREKERQQFNDEWQQPPDDLLYEQIKEALRYIPPEGDYQTDWLEVLMAIHSAFPNESGIALAESWSPGKPGEVARKFASFKRGGVSIATLFWKAKQGGYTPPKSIDNPHYHKQNVDQILRDSANLNIYIEKQKVLESTAKPRKTELPYISDLDLPESGCFLIKSPIGTGKTELAKRQIAALPEGAKTAYLAHRVLLVNNASDRLNLESYQNIPGGYDFASIDQIGVCLPSTLRYQKPPKLDLLIIDECEQDLASLFDSILDLNEPVNIHETLIYMVKNAKKVICLDAHASAVTLDWLKSIRSDVEFIENTPPAAIEFPFQMVRTGEEVLVKVTTSKTPVAIWEDKSAMVAHLDQALLTDGDPILLACGIGESKAHYERYSALLGKGKVRVINSENSAARETTDFVNKINTELPKIKLLIYSPAMGTGVDITTPVRAVYGIFRGQPHTAPEIHQQLGRARHKGEVHVCMPLEKRENPLSTNRGEIATEQRITAARAGKYIFEILPDGDRIPIITEQQQRLDNLRADIKAHRNASFNNLLGDFVRLAVDQYTIVQNNAPAVKAVKEALKQAWEAAAIRQKEAVLTAEPINQNTYDHLVNNGQFDPEVHNPGLERHKIEKFYNQPITSELFDFDHEGRGRGMVLAFTDLLTPAREVARRDYEDIAEGAALHTRKHRAKLRKLRKSLIAAVWADAAKSKTPDAFLKALYEPISEEQIKAGIEQFLSQHADDMYLFERRKVHSDDPLPLLRWMLRRLGLELELIWNCAAAGNYRVSKDSLNQMIRFYQARAVRKTEQAAAAA